MQLHALRPKRGADLGQLRNILEGRGWKAAVPSAMPDALLLRLAHDFRCVEACVTSEGDDSEDAPSFTPAIYVVTNLLMQHPAREGDASKMTVSTERVMRAVAVYQYGLEREIVSRIVGQVSGQETRALLDALWGAVHE